MSVIRFTLIDETGTASFVGPCHAIKMFVAACSQHPTTGDQLLSIVRHYDFDFVQSVESGLAVFDEHNARENTANFDTLVQSTNSRDLPPFRVLNPTGRHASLQPAGTGLILFNLPARRIVQVQNSYADVLRTDRGRVRRNGRPTRMLYRYTLPDEWKIVP